MEDNAVETDSNQQKPSDLKHLASVHFHAYIWCVVILTLVGNCVVVLWRCTRQASQRNSALSLMIVNLSIVDFLYGVHLLLLEVALTGPVFEGNTSRQYPLDSRSAVDGSLCSTAYFLSLLSDAGQSVALFSIAAYSFLSLCYPFQSSTKKAFVVGSILTQWTLALILSSISTFDSSWQVPWNMSNVTENSVNVEVYYVLTQCACAGALDPSLTPIVTVELSLIVLTTVLYLAFLFILTRRMRDQEHTEDARYLLIRLCVIVAVNILCWGPPLVLYYFGKKSISNVLMLLKDSFCLSITEVAVILLSIPPAVNPLIYTIFTKPFLGLLKKTFCMRCNKTRSKSEALSEVSESTSLFPERHHSISRYVEDVESLLQQSGEESENEKGRDNINIRTGKVLL